MFVRLTYFLLNPDKTEEGKRIYNEEIAPVIRQQPGNENAMLLEPLNKDDEFISCTIWKSQADTSAFESSAIYREVFGKIKVVTATPPQQKYYTAS